MVRIRIGEVDIPLSEASPDWIAQSIGRRQHAGLALCVSVSVRIEVDGINLNLITPACGGSGSRRILTGQEQHIVDLWIKHGLNTNGFAPGGVVAFVQQLKKILGVH